MRTKIKGGCKSRRKVVTLNSKSDLSLEWESEKIKGLHICVGTVASIIATQRLLRRKKAMNERKKTCFSPLLLLPSGLSGSSQFRRAGGRTDASTAQGSVSQSALDSRTQPPSASAFKSNLCFLPGRVDVCSLLHSPLLLLRKLRRLRRHVWNVKTSSETVVLFTRQQLELEANHS